VIDAPVVSNLERGGESSGKAWKVSILWGLIVPGFVFKINVLPSMVEMVLEWYGGCQGKNKKDLTRG
jgi:hypothetical protein